MVTWHLTVNETVSCQMPWAGNIAKTMTSNGKQFTVTREMLTAVARDRVVFKFCFCFVLLYNNSLNDWSLGEQWILSPSNLSVWDSPRDQSIKRWLFYGKYTKTIVWNASRFLFVLLKIQGQTHQVAASLNLETIQVLVLFSQRCIYACALRAA